MTRMPANGRAAYTALRERICSGEIAGEKPLTEARVSKLLGVGRGPAREALVRLEAEGLVRSRGPHSRRYVRFLYLEDMDVEAVTTRFEVRELLDGLAARRAALRLSGSDVLRLRDLCRQFAGAIRRSDRVARGEAARAIFQIIRGGCGNPLILTALEACGIRPVATRGDRVEAEVFRDRNWSARRVADMRAVVAAIAAHDAARAEAAMRAHVRACAAVFCRWLNRRKPR